MNNKTSDSTIPWSIRELLPHSKAMVLLDELLDYSEESAVTALTITENSLFLENGEVPAWVAIEYMAQGIAAFAGVQSKLAGEPIKVGLLIGTRKLVSDVAGFKVGDRLVVKVTQIHKEESGLSVFECLIDAPGGEIKANLNVFVPKDINTYMTGESDV